MTHLSRLGSFCLVTEDLAVSPGCHRLTRRPTIDLVNRRSRFEKGRIAILGTVVGIADVAGDLGLHVPHDWAEVAFLKCRRRFRSCNVLSRANLNEVNPFDLDGAAVFG